MSGVERVYRAHEFAKLAGVTIRTLHHYDRLGLLKPRRNGAGYRLYAERDLERLEHIIALKFLGLPLKQIKTLLGKTHFELSGALALQREVLNSRRELLNRTITAIEEAEEMLRRGNRPHAAILRRIIEVIEMQSNANWTEKYYSPEARQKMEVYKQGWSPELQERMSQEWTILFRDIEASLDEDPAGAKAQALTDRWCNLVGQFTRGDKEISEGLGQMWGDRANWPEEAKGQTAGYENQRVWEFIARTMEVRKADQ